MTHKPGDTVTNTNPLAHDIPAGATGQITRSSPDGTAHLIRFDGHPGEHIRTNDNIKAAQ